MRSQNQEFFMYTRKREVNVMNTGKQVNPKLDRILSNAIFYLKIQGCVIIVEYNKTKNII